MQAVLQYPEFLAAVFLTALFFVSGKSTAVPGVGPAAFILNVLPSGYVDFLERNLVYAGFRSNRSRSVLCAWKLYPGLVILPAAAFVPMVLVVLASAVLFFVPDLVLFLLVKKRQSEISQALPQSIDLMLLCVDAGLGFDATLQRIAAGERERGPSGALFEELTLLCRDVLLGMDRQTAYGELFRRTGVEDLRIFGSALNQSGRLGLSIGNILRSHSDFMRTRQQQRAEEKASKLPVWMAFPLWFCIMPALMLVLLGPSLILFISNAHPLPPGLL